MKTRNDSHLQAVAKPRHSQDVAAAEFERQGVAWTRAAHGAKTLTSRLAWAEKAQAAFDRATEVRQCQ